MPFDFSWKNLIYGTGRFIVKFVLNASINMIPTPDILKLMKYRKDATCKLCGNLQCTLHHILSNCQFALNEGRYTWGHDSVLLSLHDILVKHIETIIGLKPTRSSVSIPSLYQSFVPANPQGAKKKPNSRATKLSGLEIARDWKILTDFKDNPIVFPPDTQLCNAQIS